MPLLRPTAPDTTLDLRTRRTQAEAMPAWKRRAYVGLLWLVVVGNLLAVGLETASLWMPTELPMDIGVGRVAGVGEVTDPDLDIRPGDDVVAIDGRGVDAGSREFTRSRYREAALRSGRGPWTLTVVDSTGRTPRNVPVALQRRPDVVDDLGSSALLLPAILAGILGLLALRARERDPSVERFVVLCLVSGLPLGAFALLLAWRTLLWPLLTEGMSLSGWFLLGFALWPFVFGHALIRFLHDFLGADADERERFPVPPLSRLLGWLLRIGLAGVVGLTVVAAVAPDTPLPGAPDPESFLLLDFGLVMTVGLSVASLVVYLAVWLVRATRTVLALIRHRQPVLSRDPEAAQRVRAAVLGIRVGALSFGGVLAMVATLLASAFAAGALEAMDVDLMAPDAVALAAGVLGWALLFLALAAPFLGVGLAVLRQGLWDVDLIASRAAVGSILGVGFVGMWAVADELLEAAVPGQFELAGPILAGVAVAALRAPVSRAVQARFFPDGLDFPDLLASAARRLGAADTTAPTAVAGILHNALGASPAGLVRRASDGSVSVAWAGSDGRWPEGPAFAPLFETEADSVEVRTDQGPLLALPLEGASGRAVVLLGPRAGRGLYGREERRLLVILLAPLAHRLAS
ncbi:MAG: hypothetical protein RJQ04_02985 [Longimicrobiales bacterium]